MYNLRLELSEANREIHELREDAKYTKKAMENMEKQLKKLREYNGQILNKLGKNEA